MSNCIIFALMLWWRRRQRPGTRGNNYLVLRASRIPFGFFHLMHGRLDPKTGQLKVVSYKPITPEKQGIELVFRGSVRRGDLIKE